MTSDRATRRRVYMRDYMRRYRHTYGGGRERQAPTYPIHTPRAEVGLGPKRLARVLRFEHASALLERGTHSGLAAVAASCGYYDQPHMASDWRSLTGMTTTEWLAQELRDPLVEAAAV